MNETGRDTLKLFPLIIPRPPSCNSRRFSLESRSPIESADSCLSAVCRLPTSSSKLASASSRCLAIRESLKSSKMSANTSGSSGLLREYLVDFYSIEENRSAYRTAQSSRLDLFDARNRSRESRLRFTKTRTENAELHLQRYRFDYRTLNRTGNE